MESIDSMILTFSITHYHKEGPPTFNLAAITAVKGVKDAGSDDYSFMKMVIGSDSSAVPIYSLLGAENVQYAVNRKAQLN